VLKTEDTLHKMHTETGWRWIQEKYCWYPKCASQNRNLNGTAWVRLWATSTIISHVPDRMLPHHTNPHTFTSVHRQVWLWPCLLIHKDTQTLLHQPQAPWLRVRAPAAPGLSKSIQVAGQIRNPNWHPGDATIHVSFHLRFSLKFYQYMKFKDKSNTSKKMYSMSKRDTVE
jgi:hypothetical protein